jgi:outer membrane receptor protein involved in Fe transport
MKHITVLTFLILSCFSSILSQKKIAHITVSDDNGDCIPFATICNASGLGYVCDSIGRVVLPVNHKTELIVQALGYLSDTIFMAADSLTSKVILQKKTYELTPIGVSATQTFAYQSATSVISTQKKEIEIMNPQNIAEVLQTKVGFTNKLSYQSTLTFRGMSGKSLLVLRNGNRRFSSYPAGYMSHTINVYDLERIEIQKGAASVIYGAGAMAGIINLIDKSPFKQNGLNARLTAGYGSVNNEKNLLACGGWSNGKLAIKTGVRYRDADNYKYPNGSTAENSFYRDKDLFISGGYQFSEDNNIVFTADLHDGGPWGKAVGFNGTNYMKVSTDNEISNNLTLTYNYRSNKNLRKLALSFFYSDESRQFIKKFYTAAGYMLSYMETTSFSDYYYGTRLYTHFNISDKYSIAMGVEGYSFHISTPVDATDYIYEVSYDRRVSYNARSYTSGVFLQNNYICNPTLKLTLGLRFDYSAVYEGDVYSTDQNEEQETYKHAPTGNFAANIQLNTNNRLKLNLARSFRMPETTELFTDSYTSDGIVYANPDLEPEYSYSFDVCYRYTPHNFELEVSPFLWFIDNMISKEEINGLPGTNYEYVNIGKTRLWGGECSISFPFKELFKPHDVFSLTAGLAYLNGTDVTNCKGYMSTGTPLDYVPPMNAKYNITYDVSSKKGFKYHLGLGGIWYTQQNRLGDSKYNTPAYLCWNTSTSITANHWKTKPTINLSVNNLFNLEYYCYRSYLPSEGRNIKLFVTFNLN